MARELAAPAQVLGGRDAFLVARIDEPAGPDRPDQFSALAVSFAIASIGGAAALIAVRGSAPGKLGLTAYVLAIAPYALMAVLAIAPHVISAIGLGVRPVRVEAVLLTVLVFAGVNVAWLLLFEQATTERAA
jgi:hypothetical protein